MKTAKFFLVLCFSLCAVLSVNAQFQFEKHIINNRITEATDLITVDYDGDGDDDVVGIGDSNGYFGVGGILGLYENDNGTMIFKELYRSQFGFVQLYEKNWNNDQYIDFIAIGEKGDISFFESDGTGGVTKVRQIDAIDPKLPQSKLVNWNNDEALDVFIMGARPYVLLAGLYPEDYQVQFLNGFLPSDLDYTVSKGDLDGNGFDDILLIRKAQPNNSIVFYQNGLEMVQDNYSFEQSFINQLEFLDVNNDGLLDLFFSLELNTMDYIWKENLGDGNFDEAQNLPNLEGRNKEIFAGDFNNDGEMDILSFEKEFEVEIKVYSYDSNLNYWYILTTFEIVDVIDDTEAWIDPKCAFLDFDQDGLIDIFLNDGALGKNFLISTYPLYFESEVIDEGARWSYSMSALDLDGDGDLDFATSETTYDYEGSKLFLFRNEGDGSLPVPSVLLSGSALPRDLHALDLDLDGDNELIVSTNPELQVFENLNEEEYGELVIINSSNAAFISFPDLNDDSFPDLLYATGSTDQIFYQLNNGDLTFSEPTEIGYGFESAYPAHQDFTNAQGEREFVYVLDRQLYHQILEPGINFSSLELLNGEVFIDDFTVRDVNSDGILDLVAAGSPTYYHQSNEIIHLYGQLDGTFSDAEYQTDSGLDAFVFHEVDFNGDGIDDIVTAGGIILTGNEYDFFPFDVSLRRLRTISIDWDLDGDQDVVVNDSNEVVFLENTSGSGCNDNTACNFNPSAVVNDGSCCFGDCSCNDPLATNYNPSGECTSQCLYTINGFVFRDNDLDEFRDPGEPGIEGITVYESNSGVSTITNEVGAYQFANLPQRSNIINLGTIGINSQIQPNYFETDEWNINSDVNFSVRESYESDLHLQTRSEPHNYACNDTTTFYLDLINPFQNQKEGYFSICLDELIPEIIGTNFPTDSIVGKCIYASFDTNDYVEQYEVQFLSPDVEYIGETLTHFSAAFVDNGIGIYSAEAQDILQGEMLCSYDPNDKNCNLVGYEEPHFIVDDSTLTYTIRFQNTGNAPADQVLLRDTLSPYLRGATIEFLTASHNMIPAYNPGSREMTFLFPNINLPDSTSNPEASQGYVQYRVKTVALLGQGTEIENTAYIFFDNNPAIITNTTLHTIYDCNNSLADFDVSGDGFCLGDDVTLTSSQPYIESYEWTVNGELLSSNNELSFTDISGEMEISLKVSNPICEATQTVVVNPDAQPTLSIENNEFEICPSAEITLIAESTGTISWGDYGTGSELIVQDPNEGVIQVVTTSPGGCTNTSEVSVTYISEDPVFSVENNILTASEAESYQWYQNGDPIDDATNSTFEIIESGSYAVELSYTNGCISISEFQFVGYVGINQQEVSDFLIVPNPAESSFRITGLNAQIVQFYLVNSQGQLVLTGLAQNKQIIQLPAISTGMYFLHLEGYSKPMKLMVR